MSSPRKKSSVGHHTGTGSKRKGQAGSDGPGASWEPELALDSRLLGFSEGKGQGQDQARSGREARRSAPQALQWPLKSESGPEPEPAMIQAGATGFNACEGWPSIAVPEREGPLGSLSVFLEAHAALVQPQSRRGYRAIRRSPSPRSRAAAEPAIWLPDEPGPSCRGAMGWGYERLLEASAVPWLESLPREGGLSYRSARPQVSSRTDVLRACGEGLMGLPSDPESYDELRGTQTGRASTNLKRGRQAKGSDLDLAQPTESPTYSISPGSEDCPHVSSPFSTSALWGRDSAIEGQVLGESGPSSLKKLKIWLSGKVRGKPSTPRGAGGTGGTEVLPQAVPRRQLSLGKECLGNAPEAVFGTTLAPQKQRQALMDPATAPPVTGISLLGKPGTSSSLLREPKQSKQGSPQKKPGAKRQTQPVTRGALDSNRDADPRTDVTRNHVFIDRYQNCQN
ncbi:uncharacterized protein CXorf49 homolog [Ochotona princeps]|uniref:uncharacterized protein CXorf49 homolog n=1 Tax=Ochotona princeps TaxID=9978 RepID=UPI00271469C8|nr:uncharacterized protein CXorf49 homolog [Ochotona princeps]